MENSYVSRLIENQTICTMNGKRYIITDRMGTWNKQSVVLTWEGWQITSNSNFVSITPDEVEVLFTKGLIRNVARGENGKLYEKTTFLDGRDFAGAIVCGILAPSTQANLRPEICDYAKKMGYITDIMTPVKMFSGTKSLIFNTDGTYSILFVWNDSVLKKINQELLHNFTKNFFRNYSVEVKNNGILMLNLSEDFAFSRKSIDIFRVYDIQLFYLNPKFDKKLLLRAIMQRAFISFPYNILKRNQFEKLGNTTIPEDKKEPAVADEESETMKHLDERIFESPAFAVETAAMEVVHMGQITMENVRRAMDAVLTKNANEVEDVYKTEQTINNMEKMLTEYLVKVNNLSLTERQKLVVNDLFYSINEIERVVVHAENLAEQAEYMVQHNISFSETGESDLHVICETAFNSFKHSINARQKGDMDDVRKVSQYEDEVDTLEEELREKHIERLSAGKCDPSAGVVFLDLISNLERISDHAYNIAGYVKDEM